MNRLRTLVAAALFLCTLAGASAHADAPAALPWLRTEGDRIVDAPNHQVILNGVNVGGWLVEEPWMMPFVTKPPTGSPLPPAKDHVSLWRVVEKRFGKPEMQRVRTALRDAWVNADDFKRIHAAGLNCVRLPFTYDLFDEADGGFPVLDRAVDQARANGLYVILDLHGAPGRQSASDHTGESDVNRLFKDPAMIQRTETLWTKIARHYRDRPEVAGYDLLNEPMGAPDSTTLWVIQDRLFRAIRAADDRHLIFVEEGYKGTDTFPRPASVGWSDVVLSWHHYNFNAKSEADQANGLAGIVPVARRVGASRNAPVYIGEFQIEPHGTPAVLADGLKRWQEAGLSWTIWTYKTAMTDGGGGMWGWYHPAHPITPLDPFRDSPADMLRKITQVRTGEMAENTAMTAAFRAAVRVAPLPPPVEIAPTARSGPRVLWRWITDKPSGSEWTRPGFDASSWSEGPAGFGANADEMPAEFVRTPWKTADIYLRREFTLPVDATNLALVVSHDDDAEIYINGVLAADLPSYAHAYAEVPIRPEALAALKPGGVNILSVHCHQFGGGQYVDVGLTGQRPK